MTERIMKYEDLRIGIALSGGGARGIAHIGVLSALEEVGVSPQVISGTSAGAVAGALYASGHSPEAMLDFVKDASIFKMLKVTFPYTGLTKLTYLEERLKSFIDKDDFAALKRKLFVSVTNLNTGSSEILEEGPLFRAVLASSSIPLIFKPMDIEGQLFVDGGLLNNLPVKPLVYADVDIIIGVNVMPLVDASQKSVQSALGIATRCFDLSIQANTRPNTEFCDVFIEPRKVHAYTIFQLSKYQELFEIGYQAAREKIPELKEKLQEARDRKLAVARRKQER